MTGGASFFEVGDEEDEEEGIEKDGVIGVEAGVVDPFGRREVEPRPSCSTLSISSEL